MFGFESYDVESFCYLVENTPGLIEYEERHPAISASSGHAASSSGEVAFTTKSRWQLEEKQDKVKEEEQKHIWIAKQRSLLDNMKKKPYAKFMKKLFEKNAGEIF